MVKYKIGRLKNNMAIKERTTRQLPVDLSSEETLTDRVIAHALSKQRNVFWPVFGVISESQSEYDGQYIWKESDTKYNLKSASKVFHSASTQVSKMTMDNALVICWGIANSTCNVGRLLAKNPNSVCAKCYGDHGAYIWHTTKTCHQKRLQSLMRIVEDSRRYNQRYIEYVLAFASYINIKAKNRAKIGQSTYFRWLDMGDIQTSEKYKFFHLRIIRDIARLCPMVKFWLPTKEYSLMLSWDLAGYRMPDNVNVLISNPMIDSEDVMRRWIDRKFRHPELYGTTLVSSQGNHTCKAYDNTPTMCGTCDKCWTKKHVIYPEH